MPFVAKCKCHYGEIAGIFLAAIKRQGLHPREQSGRRFSRRHCGRAKLCAIDLQRCRDFLQEIGIEMGDKAAIPNMAGMAGDKALAGIAENHAAG